MEFKYRALQIRQTGSSKMLALFAAPATDISEWAGIPEKKRFGEGDEETVGFQRTEDEDRVKSLGKFCANDENIIQNPLLCATRKTSEASVSFVADSGALGDAIAGTITIKCPDYNTYVMKDILELVREYIEARVPKLVGKKPNPKLIADLKAKAIQSGHLTEETKESVDDEIDKEDDADGEKDVDTLDDTTETEAALFEESHIEDFWAEIAGRCEVIKLIESTQPKDEFLSFKKSALISYLLPIVLVDGQHRLKGTLRAAHERLELDETIRAEIKKRINEKETGPSVEKDILNREARRLPLSLLLADDPAEQVFQFVIVNQKATPVGRALLGTIVSTTLSNDELDKVATRLKDAGIELEESQAITFLARSPTSPFSGLIERGMVGKSQDLLQWNVFRSLIGIFRNLKGGKPYNSKNDYAEAWKMRFLDTSPIVDKWDSAGCTSAYQYWRKLDGPWRDVFIEFFSAIRKTFGDIEIPDAPNYWGRPRTSNLFNKVSLTILSADFFQYVLENKKSIGSAQQIPEMVDGWLDGVSPKYFNRNWQLSDIKKDSPGIRKQWDYQWTEYRKNPTQLPQTKLYRISKSD